jgi:hypothetical protein
MAYIQQPKSPTLKALKGNQGKLPQHLQDAIKAAPESVAKQTTAGEFAHQQYEMDKKTGKATRDIDKVKSVWDAITTDKTYPEAKKGYRKKQKEKYNNMSKVEKVITKATSRQNSHKK